MLQRGISDAAVGQQRPAGAGGFQGRLGTMKFRMSKTTLCLAAPAVACYALSWTGIAVGLGVAGMFFEAFCSLSSMRDDALHAASNAADERRIDAEAR